MATIALYGTHINQISMRMDGIKRAILDYDQELFSLQAQVLTINRNVCNVEDATSLIQESALIQEQAASSVETIGKDMEGFIEEAIAVDAQVAELIDQQKDDFYSKYRYLKPDCEKDFWDREIDRVLSMTAWCLEHWKAAVTIVLVIAATVTLVVVALTCPVVGLALFVVKTAASVLLGTLVGGAIGGSLSALFGGSFWEGFEDGAFGGALGGLLFGGIGYLYTQGGNTALTFAQLMKAAGTVGGSVSLIGDIGDVLIKGEDISLGQMIQHAIVSAAFSMAFAAVFYGIGKVIRALRPQPVGEGTGGGSTTEGGTDVNPQSPMFGEDWHRYFNETYGQENVTWESASIQDIIDMPSKITDFSPNQIANLAKANGWSVSPLGKGGLAGVPYEQGGGFSMHAPNGGSEYIQYHPGGGHHGKSPYFKISSGPNGIVRYFIGGNGQ